MGDGAYNECIVIASPRLASMIRLARPTPPVVTPRPQSAPSVRPTDERKAYGAPFWLSYASNMLVMVGIALLYRFADFVTGLGGGEYELGWIVGVGMIGSLATRLTIGAGIDRRGPRLIWIGSTVLFIVTCFAHLAITSCDSPPIYLLRILYCSALAGIFGASLTFVSARAPAARIAEMVGVLGTAGFLGQMLGTALGDLLVGGETIQPWQTDLMFVVAALLGVASMPLIFLATRHLPPPMHRARLSLPTFLRQYNPGTVLLIAAAAGMGLCLPQTFLPTYTAGLGIPRMGLFFGIYAPAAIITRVSTRRWPERFGPEPMILLGIGGLVASQLTFLLVSAEWQLLVPGIGYGIFHAILFPSVIAAGTRRAPEHHRGMATSLTLAVWDAGALVGAPLAGAIVQYSGGLGLPPYPTMFVTLGALMIAAGIFYGLTCRRKAPLPHAIMPEPHAGRLAEAAARTVVASADVNA
jgi:MFS family permease